MKKEAAKTAASFIFSYHVEIHARIYKVAGHTC